ncbi:ABC transporter substrate-binding protein [Pseudochrobactrum asaccharolyticum]|uniref:Putative spermidine/putrescine transport system substrate-binding protein n=2 Tax=Brucellaceae TaxID=118882 RepID=A0A366DMI3_9HYPH|nr:ABC transporter substrate-binding protein [Pseudochrobactrum asaccharolyticum]MDR2310639.1 ABC transporter substrate-binding protein [Brucellaceae bacterium]RBO91155.1 putative spermidine/putrescine transport system substrate-binding protein [Pseudochrobactrum asaccharolyticum]
MRYLKLALLATCTIMAANIANARDFTIAGYGGKFQDAARTAYFEPFTKTKGIKYQEAIYLGGLAELKTMADTGNVKWDLVITEGPTLQMGCDEGLFEVIEWDKVAHKDDLMEAAVQTCGAGNVVIGNGFAYNSDVFSDAPKDWKDFFDREKYPGKRGMKNQPMLNLEYALMADGVPVDKVYDVLNTPEGVDRAFAKMDTIKDLLQYWESGSQPVEWMAAGNVALSTAHNGRIIMANQEGKPLNFVWKNHIYNIDVWAIPANSPNKELALEFLSTVNTPQNQAVFSKVLPYGPTNMKAAAFMEPGVAESVPVGNNIAEALFLNDAFWIDHGEELMERWNNWSSR